MKTRYIHFREHFFFYILIPLITLTSAASYYRFIVKHDYIVGYEGVCDPTTNKCFVGCKNDNCGEKYYYYSKMEKYAPDLYMQCGKDITNCEAASICLPDDHKCSVTYCNTVVDGDTCEKEASIN